MSYYILGLVLIVVLIGVGVRYFYRRFYLGSSGKYKKCPHCGRFYKEGNYYCPHCGEVVGNRREDKD